MARQESSAHILRQLRPGCADVCQSLLAFQPCTTGREYCTLSCASDSDCPMWTATGHVHTITVPTEYLPTSRLQVALPNSALQLTNASVASLPLAFAAERQYRSADWAIRMATELRPVATSEDWEAYHSIREQVLWEARGRFGSYDRSHPDEHKVGNFACLLVGSDDQPIGVVRIDLEPPLAWFRRVAIRADRQRQGYGTRMSSPEISRKRVDVSV